MSDVLMRANHYECWLTFFCENNAFEYASIRSSAILRFQDDFLLHSSVSGLIDSVVWKNFQLKKVNDILVNRVTGFKLLCETEPEMLFVISNDLIAVQTKSSWGMLTLNVPEFDLISTPFLDNCLDLIHITLSITLARVLFVFLS